MGSENIVKLLGNIKPQKNMSFFRKEEPFVSRLNHVKDVTPALGHASRSSSKSKAIHAKMREKKEERHVSFAGGRGRAKTASSEHLERNPHLSPKN